LVRVDLGHGPGRLPPRWLVAPDAEVQVDPAALELELVDLAFAVVLAAGLEGEDLEVAGEVLELGRFSYRHPTQRSGVCAVRDMAVRLIQPNEAPAGASHPPLAAGPGSRRGSVSIPSIRRGGSWLDRRSDGAGC
jgi:hypothetical protein